MFDLGELLGVPYVDFEMGFDLSPDGGKVAFSWNASGSWEIYEKDLIYDLPPKILTSGQGGKFHPRYSPDGKFLAFSLDPDGGEQFHIILYDLASGGLTDLTPFDHCSLQANFDWSPDGKQIAFISDQDGQFNTYVMQVEDVLRGSKPRLLLDAGYPAWKVSWSPDGKWLAVVVEASGIDYGTFIVPSGGGEVKRISVEASPIDAGQACWNLDSRTVAFSSDCKGFNNIGLFDVKSGLITWLTQGEDECQHPRWSPDGRMLTYVVNRGTVSWVAVKEFGHEARLTRVEQGVHYHPMFTNDGRGIIFGFDNPRHPTDLWLLSLETNKLQQLTHSLPEKFTNAQFIMPEEVRYPGMDGAQVPALLFKPRNTNGAAVLVVHGGPDWLFEMTWYPLMQILANKGWVVLAPNYRGSTGYGRDWQDASRFDFGGVDTDDTAAGALYLLRGGLAEPGKVGITGRSHGGYLTASCLTRYPDLWAVGSAVVPFLNWFTNHAEIRPDLQAWDLENFGDPETNAELWRERSPSFFLDRVKSPLQLICGKQDARCPVSDSLQACKELTEMGKPVELILYEDEGHTFLKKENVLDSELRRIAFLKKYLELQAEE